MSREKTQIPRFSNKYWPVKLKNVFYKKVRNNHQVDLQVKGAGGSIRIRNKTAVKDIA